MRKLIIGLMWLVPLGLAHAQGEAGVNLLPMVLGKVATGPNGHATAYPLDATYGVGLSVGYRFQAGVSVGLAPQVVFHLSAKDDGGYSVLDSQKEYDLMARIAYTYSVVPKIDVYAEFLPGYAIVTYNQIVLGNKAYLANGIVLGGGVGAAFALTDRFFANASVGYQQGFQKASYIRVDDVQTKFVRLAIGGGVKF